MWLTWLEKAAERQPFLWRKFGDVLFRKFPLSDFTIIPAIFRNSVQGMYLFEIKRFRRITSFLGNDLATVLIAVVCIVSLVRVTLVLQK